MNKTPVVLLLCLSMGCSTTRSAAAVESARTARVEAARVEAAELCRETPNGIVVPWLGNLPINSVRCINGVPQH